MLETEYNIDCLPEWILEEIFSYLSDIKALRLVSTNFKYVVDNSRKLMSQYLLNISKKARDSPDSAISCFFQQFYCSSSHPVALDVIKNYQLKEWIKSVILRISNSVLIESFLEFQKAFISYDKLEEIFIYIPHKFDDDNRRRQEYDIEVPEFPYLKSLTIRNDYYCRSNILFLFVNSPKLKKLSLKDIEDSTDFYNNTKWKLEEFHLRFVNRAILPVDFRTKEFPIVPLFEQQGSSMKILEIKHGNNLNDIVQKLPNLEILRLEHNTEDDLNDDLLLSNNKLKELSIVDSCMKSETLEKVLLHYNNIERLYIDICTEIKFDGLILPNLKHITLSDEYDGFLSRLKLYNLRSLTIIGLYYDLSFIPTIPAETLRNIENLKTKFERVKDIPRILEFFPNLRHLYLLGKYKEVTVSVLTNILNAKDLLSINILKESWKLEISPTDFLSQMNNKKCVIKLYSYQNEMIGEEDIKIENICIDRYNNSELFCDERGDFDGDDSC